jgi:UDP-N-acetylglucosamine 2-epimerase (non-hydrolysing)
MSQILICYGTRPEWLKVVSLVQELTKNQLKYKTLYTGQHTDIAPKDADYTFNITDTSTNRLNSIVSCTLNIPDTYFKGITHVLVQGDTTSALSLALNAFHRKLKIIHLEAGLRTYNTLNPYPEEINRQLISRIADIHLCPTQNNKNNLVKENCKGVKFVTGNTCLDNLVNITPTYSNKILVTLHRRENHDIIKEWFVSISKLAKKYKNYQFILPLHPNPCVQKHKNVLSNVTITEPLNHTDLLKILAECRLVITDSGGIQEEASFLNKKVIVCRKFTERTESLNTHSFLCSAPARLNNLFNTHINSFKIRKKSPYGDGKSSKKIISIFKKIVY